MRIQIKHTTPLPLPDLRSICRSVPLTPPLPSEVLTKALGKVERLALTQDGKRIGMARNARVQGSTLTADLHFSSHYLPPPGYRLCAIIDIEQVRGEVRRIIEVTILLTKKV